MSTDLDILITGGMLLTMTESMEKVPNAEIGIKDGTILFARTADANRASPPARDRIDASGCVIMPGLVNTHTHLPMACFRGLADDLPLKEWLADHIIPAETRYVNRDMVYYGSLLGIAEMLLSGTTTFCDGYFYSSSVADAAIMAGIRGVIGFGILDRPGDDNYAISRRRAAASDFIQTWKGASSLITPAIFCHSTYTCSPATLTSMKELSQGHDLPYLIHVAETIDEVSESTARYGLSPVMHLATHNVLDRRTVAVHCVWIDDDEMKVIAGAGSGIAHAPESNMKLASGIAPVHKMHAHGITVGLGTDGCASNNDLDLIREMGTAARIQKIGSMDPTVLSAEAVLRMATIDGARILGLDGSIGSIEAGKCADIIIIDMKKPHLTPVYNEYSLIVYAASGADVQTTIVNGTVVMRDRKLVSFEAQTAIDHVLEIAGRIMQDRGLCPRPSANNIADP